jgi:hypothetical protein
MEDSDGRVRTVQLHIADDSQLQVCRAIDTLSHDSAIRSESIVGIDAVDHVVVAKIERYHVDVSCARYLVSQHPWRRTITSIY